MRRPIIVLLGVALVLAGAGGLSAVAEPAPEAPATRPAFERLEVTIEPFEMHDQGPERLRIDAGGRCWYRVEPGPARGNLEEPRGGANIDHVLAAERVGRLNELLAATDWLTAPGAEGPATHTHPTTITLALTRAGETRTVVCEGQKPEPYASLLLELRGLALQERRIYLVNWVSGKEGRDAWKEIGQEVKALRGGPYIKQPLPVDYERYLPIAQRIVSEFHNRTDDELVPAIGLIGHFRAAAELENLHQMAHDRSGAVRRELAWALGRIHDPSSLPVLVSMTAAGGTRYDVGLELIRWGDEATPHIAKLIATSTDKSLEPRQRTIGEDMVRAYLEHWDRVEKPIDEAVVAAVRRALEKADPRDGTIRTEYHREFLGRAGAQPAGAREPGPLEEPE